MKIYLSGAISGLNPVDAFEQFDRAENIVAMAGHKPVKPLSKASEAEGKTWAEYMAEDIVLLDACDAIFMLENWEDSDGSRIEYEIARVRGKRIFYAVAADELPVVGI